MSPRSNASRRFLRRASPSRNSGLQPRPPCPPSPKNSSHRSTIRPWCERYGYSNPWTPGRGPRKLAAGQALAGRRLATQMPTRRGPRAPTQHRSSSLWPTCSEHAWRRVTTTCRTCWDRVCSPSTNPFPSHKHRRKDDHDHDHENFFHEFIKIQILNPFLFGELNTGASPRWKL